MSTDERHGGCDRDSVRRARPLFLVGVVVAALIVPTEAFADSEPRGTCIGRGPCALTLEAAATWFPKLPPLSLRTPVAGLERSTMERPGSAFFPVGLAIDLRFDTRRFFVPALGFAGAFAPGSAMTIEQGKRRLDIGDTRYAAFLLPGVGVHLTDHVTDGRNRVSVSARLVYSTFVVSGTATADGRSATFDTFTAHGWGVIVGIEACGDVLGVHRGVCGFLQGTQAYSSGLQHAVTTGLRIVF
jgi:hypothetical protein